MSDLRDMSSSETSRRFERNVEADYNVYAVGKTWVNTDGVSIKPDSTLDYDFYVDDMTLCDAVTVEHNVLGPGAVA